MTLLRLFNLVVFAAAVGLFGPSCTAQTLLQGRASVIDGDTLEIHGQRIWFHGIDAPESSQTCERSGKPWRCGQAAALALSDWLGQATVTCQQTGVDRYRRVVARCIKAGLDVAAWLVSEGWALDWPRYSGGAYARQQEDAKAANRAIWSSTFQAPWDWRGDHRRTGRQGNWRF